MPQEPTRLRWAVSAYVATALLAWLAMLFTVLWSTAGHSAWQPWTAEWPASQMQADDDARTSIRGLELLR